MNSPTRLRLVRRLMLDLAHAVASSPLARLIRRERAPTQDVLDLSEEHPDANADPLERTSDHDPSVADPSEPVDLTDEPNDSRNTLKIKIELLGGRAEVSINGLGTPLYAAAAVFVMSLSTVFPIIVLPGRTGFIPAVIALGWLGLSVLIAVFTFGACRRSRRPQDTATTRPGRAGEPAGVLEPYDESVLGGEVIRRARRRAGLTEVDLAARLNMPAEKLAELERSDAPFSEVERAVAACGRDLVAVLAEPEPDPHDLSLMETTLRMTVDERLERLISYVRFVLAGRAALRNAR